MEGINPSRKRKIEKEPAVTAVGMDEYKVIKAGMIGETVGLGPCFGVIIYDSVNKCAIMGHFSDPNQTREKFNRMISEAEKRFKNKDQVKIYVGGGAPVDAPHFRYDKKNRSFVENALKNTGFKIEKISYQSSEENTALLIDTRSGKVDYETEFNTHAENL